MSSGAGELSAWDLHFSKYVLGGLGLFAAGLSLSEQDRRSLFLSDVPEAFAVTDLGNGGPANFPIFIGTGGAGTPLQRTLLRTGGAGTPGFIAPPGPAAPGGVGGAPMAPAEIPPAGAAPITTSAPAAAGGTPVVPGGIPPFGGGSGPIAGIVPTTTTPTDPVTPGPGVDPVVPTVPEPASWLLMLIGVGALGAALRRRRARELATATIG